MCAVKSQMPQVIDNFSTEHVNRKWGFCNRKCFLQPEVDFCIIGEWFYPNVRQNFFIRERTFSSTILVALGMINGRRYHFRLTNVAEKRLCLSSLMSYTSVRVFGSLLTVFW